jgi:hypothetical protein
MLGVCLVAATSSAHGVGVARTKKRVGTTRSKNRITTTRPKAPVPTSNQASSTFQDLGTGPQFAGCPTFPADNAWNRDVSALAVHPQSATWVAAVNANKTMLHPDTGSNPDYGIPFVVVGPNQPQVPVKYVDYGDESDPGPFPIPLDAPVESGGDRHVIVVQTQTCRLFELFNATAANGSWQASSGAAYDLKSNALRPKGWTSADAAGLPIFPGLLRVDEVRSGEIRHALRFTASKTQRGFIAPARHFAGSADPSLPPMGARFRLKANADLSKYTGDSLVILKALQKYGMLLADNGSSWFISGAKDPRWNDDDLNQLKTVPGSWFEVVDTGPIETG